PMRQRVRITDVSPRDGLQNEPVIIPAARKVRLIELLSRTGVDEIEATSFVSPKWVPQLGDAEQVIAGVREVMRRRDSEARNGAGESPPSGRGRGGQFESGIGASESPPSGRGRGGPVPPRNNPKSIEPAKELRRSLTGPEIALWQRLKNKQLAGHKFRRQH